MRFISILNEKIFISEDLEGKLSRLVQMLLAKKSRWPMKSSPDASAKAEQYIRDAAEFDPTTNKKYTQFIVSQISHGRIKLPEDGPQIKHVLGFFNNNKWPERKSDIFQYDDWRELHKEVNELEHKITAGKSFATTVSQFEKKCKKGGEKLFEDTINDKYYKIVRINTPEAATVYGRGAQWCTTASLFTITAVKYTPEGWFEYITTDPRVPSNLFRHTPFKNFDRKDFIALVKDLNKDAKFPDKIKVPNVYYSFAIDHATSYLKTGPMYIVYKDNKPYIQIDSADQIMNEDDVPLKKLGGPTAKFLYLLVKSKKLGDDENDYFEKIVTSFYIVPTKEKRKLN